MGCTREEGGGDGDNCLRSLLILATVVNASVDDHGENRHTGGVGGLSLMPSIEEGGDSKTFIADRSAFVHEMRKVQLVMLIAWDVV